MPTVLDVENQQFKFGDQWSLAFKYDDSDFYRKEAIRLQGNIEGVAQSAKAVDVVALHGQEGLLLLEAKDFRGHRIANKPRILGEVAVEVAVKARDTLAALVGAARKPVTEFPSAELVAALEVGKEVRVVLWLEDDTFTDEKKTKVALHTLNQRLKSLLPWLQARAFVSSSAVPNKINHLTVSNLPGAGQPNP